MLVNRATRAFVAFHRIISTATLATPLGQEFGNILRTHILPEARYTAAATAGTLQGASTLPNSAWSSILRLTISGFDRKPCKVICNMSCLLISQSQC